MCCRIFPVRCINHLMCCWILPVRCVNVLQDILDITANVYAEKPQKDIYNFVGTFTRVCLSLYYKK